jgi:hypothetical protein
MSSVEQTKGMNILEHGISVARYYNDLIKIIKSPESHKLKYEWKIPDWAFDPEILASLLPAKTTSKYHIYHDCGKPFCLNIDDKGKRHFPNHAKESYKIWNSINLDDDISWLILHDMDIHIAKAKDVESIANTKYWATMLLTGLSELHSNAAMFGGIESIIFKIKYKNLDKMGKRILNHIKTKGDK